MRRASCTGTARSIHNSACRRTFAMVPAQRSTLRHAHVQNKTLPLYQRAWFCRRLSYVTMVSAATANTLSSHSSRSCSAFFCVSSHKGISGLFERSHLSPALVSLCAPSFANARWGPPCPTTAGLASPATAMSRTNATADTRSDPPGYSRAVWVYRPCHASRPWSP